MLDLEIGVHRPLFRNNLFDEADAFPGDELRRDDRFFLHEHDLYAAGFEGPGSQRPGLLHCTSFNRTGDGFPRPVRVRRRWFGIDAFDVQHLTTEFDRPRDGLSLDALDQSCASCLDELCCDEQLFL